MNSGRYFVAPIMLVIFSSGCASTGVSTSRKGLLDSFSEYRVKPRVGDQVTLRDRERHRAQVATWQWPLKRVAVTSPFGERGDKFHEGIDLKAGVGTPVYAVDDGKVLYSGSKVSGYGNLVILKHAPSGLVTVYAHNSKIFVRKGQLVKRGQKISASGRSGRARGPHLHFEVRDGIVPIDPVVLLTRSQLARR